MFRSNDDFIFHKRTDCSRLYRAEEAAAASAIGKVEEGSNWEKGARTGDLLPQWWLSSIEGVNDSMTPNDASSSLAAQSNAKWIKKGANIVLSFIDRFSELSFLLVTILSNVK